MGRPSKQQNQLSLTPSISLDFWPHRFDVAWPGKERLSNLAPGTYRPTKPPLLPNTPQGRVALIDARAKVRELFGEMFENE